MNREGFWGILQSRRASYLRAYLLWTAYFLVCAFLKDWWYAEPANPPVWELSLNIADSMFAPVALGIPASIFIVEVVWDGIMAVKRKGEDLMGMVFKELENKWVKKGREQGREQGLEQGREQGREQGLEQGREQGREQGLEQGREQEYKRITEELRKQGIDYTPQPPERTNKK